MIIENKFRFSKFECIHSSFDHHRAYRVAVPLRESHISHRNATQGFLYVHNEQSHVPSLTTIRDRLVLKMRRCHE